MNRAIDRASKLQDYYYTETEIIQALEELGFDSIRSQAAMDLLYRDNFTTIERDKLTDVDSSSRLKAIVVRIFQAGTLSCLFSFVCLMTLSMVGNSMSNTNGYFTESELLKLELRLQQQQESKH